MCIRDSLFDELHKAGRTVVLITHEKDVADRAGRVVRLRDGLVTDDSLASAVAVSGARS